MKRIARTVLLLLTILSLASSSSLASGLLPTPRPSQNTGTGTLLPNFGSCLGSEGDLTAEDYAYDGRTWTAWYYPQADNWSNALNDFIGACKERGFTMTVSSFNNTYTGYILEHGGLRAILVPDIDGSILLMTEKGLAMEEYSAAEKKVLNIGDVRITYNGKTYNCSKPGKLFLNEYGGFYQFFSSVSGELHWIDFNIPTRVETGTHHRFTSVQYSDTNGWYKLCILDGSHPPLANFASFAPRGLFVGPKDYFEVNILYRDKYEVYGIYEGCFDNGKHNIRVEFRLAL